MVMVMVMVMHVVVEPHLHLHLDLDHKERDWVSGDLKMNAVVVVMVAGSVLMHQVIQQVAADHLCRHSQHASSTSATNRNQSDTTHHLPS